ncbi:dUTP diphosphatase [Staphylococcus saprophyticus]|uniref:dUTP diphosphatase n=1 Tax=Staphylococcus saprophyticus TaxID=29385 RepID=UPI0008534A75|nr:dUTP pyrophosphatase [Staphylococcus saprophyticus]OEK40823.1 dUTP pyrophosphatase [Staphylococcus saprophyticus]
MTDTLQIKPLSDNATKPKRADDESAGYDIYAAETVILEPQQKALVATDLAVNIPKGYVGLLTSRSGVSSKTHIVVETGKIDAGYQGHMKINVKNDEQRLDLETLVNNEELERNYKEPLVYDINDKKITNGNPFEVGIGRKYQINKGDRLAQLVIVPIFTPELVPVEEFESETARGQNGFGSSGTR